jgi:hypothetical protein
MIFAVASMVIMSHGGEGDRLQGHVWALWTVFAGVCLALVLRFMVVVFSGPLFSVVRYFFDGMGCFSLDLAWVYVATDHEGPR